MDALKDHDESGYYITREIKVHERSEKEVASEMGITIGNLRVKMTRTKKWLCQHFADKARERDFCSYYLRSHSWIRERMRPMESVWLLFFIALI